MKNGGGKKNLYIYVHIHICISQKGGTMELFANGARCDVCVTPRFVEVFERYVEFCIASFPPAIVGFLEFKREILYRFAGQRERSSVFGTFLKFATFHFFSPPFFREL